MDGEVLRALYHHLFRSNNLQHIPRRGTYSDAVILWVALLAAFCDRPVKWAAQKSNWPLWCRRIAIPSYSQIMRRLATSHIRQLVAQIDEEFRRQLPSSNEKAIDGKPLVIGGFSKDPDARFGKSPGGWSNGYKLHALIDSSGKIERFCVTPLRAGESTVARTMLAQHDLDGVIVRGDANYDSNKLYDFICQRGGRLIAPRRKPGRGLGKRTHHRHRLDAIELLEGSADAHQHHRRLRDRAEQSFGHLTNLPFGLAPLPNWVRRIQRVERWVALKILLFHAYRAMRSTIIKAA